MSHGLDILDEFTFKPAELSPLDPRMKARRPARTVFAASGSQRQVQVAPFFIRDISPQDLGADWEGFCGLLRQYGIFAFNTATELSRVPLSALPSRWGCRYANKPFNAEDLTTADGFEIVCRDSRQGNWGWTFECPPERLAQFVAAVRQAGGGDTSIGVGLPLVCHGRDLERCIRAGVDFISFIAEGTQPVDLQCLTRARALLKRIPNDRNKQNNVNPADVPGQRPPILFTAPVRRVEHAIKLLCLGASAVCLDNILVPLLTPAADVRSPTASLLGVTAPRRSDVIPRITEALDQLAQEIERCLLITGVEAPPALRPDCLRALSTRSRELVTAELVTVDD